MKGSRAVVGGCGIVSTSTFSTLYFNTWWSLTFFISSARDQCVWRPGLGQLQSQQQHVVGRQQRPVTGGAAPGLRVPPQGQRDTYQHPHAETWEHQVLRLRVESKKARRWSTALTLSLLGPTTYHLENRNWFTQTHWTAEQTQVQQNPHTGSRHIYEPTSRVSVREYLLLSNSYPNQTNHDFFCSNFSIHLFSHSITSVSMSHIISVV